MFSWFRKPSSPPPRAAENPGKGHWMRVAFANGNRSWEESADLTSLLAESLTGASHKFSRQREWLELHNGLLLVPHVVQVTPSDDGATMKTVSTIQVSHPKWVPKGVFEFQHSWGPDVRQSFSLGFDQWAQVDLPVFLYAAGDEATNCKSLTMKPGREGNSLIPPNRRVIVGPTSHLVNQPATESEEHGFCPCCLFTHSVDAFRDLIHRDEFFGIRLFAWRSADGATIEADCRVNGVDFPAALEGLKRYASSWPMRGLEFRKQYVALQAVTPLQDP